MDEVTKLKEEVREAFLKYLESLLNTDKSPEELEEMRRQWLARYSHLLPKPH